MMPSYGLTPALTPALADPGKWIAERVPTGTTKRAKCLLHHLAHEPPQHKSARMNKANGQLEFQSTGDPVLELPFSAGTCLCGSVQSQGANQRLTMNRLCQNEGLDRAPA